MARKLQTQPAQAYLLAPPTDPDGAGAACPECGRPLSPLFGPAQRALIEGAPEFHVACLERMRLREERAGAP